MATESEMQEWIVEDGGLYHLGGGKFLEWNTTWDEVMLDGDFSVDELRWIAAYIEAHRENHNIPERTAT